MAHLYFVPNGMSGSGKTQIWNVHAIQSVVLGIIRWYAPWRKYCFLSEGQMIFDKGCLRELADFCEMKTKEHVPQG